MAENIEENAEDKDEPSKKSEAEKNINEDKKIESITTEEKTEKSEKSEKSEEAETAKNAEKAEEVKEKDDSKVVKESADVDVEVDEETKKDAAEKLEAAIKSEKKAKATKHRKPVNANKKVEKKRILLIYPPSPVMNREDRCQQPVKELLVIPPLPPTDLMYMAAVAEKITEPCTYEAKIVDYSLVNKPFDVFKKDLQEFKPDYLVVNVTSTMLKNDLSVLDVAKEIVPNVITIAKGAHFLTSNTDVLYDYKNLDLIMIGEVENTLREILEEYPYEIIKGLCYRDGFVAKYTGRRPFINNLDTLPFPARHLVDNKKFRRPDNNKVQAVIKVSRGCPHHCFFCLATRVSGSKVRMRSPENIVEEIKECVDKYGIKNFLFWSDVFNADREWVLDLCDEIIDNDLDITWSANARADNVDDEMAEAMYDAGCRLVSIGVESGSQYILDQIGKKTTIEQIIDTVKLFKELGIKVYNYFVIGLPWDDERTIEDTIDFAILLNSDFVSFYTAAPLPGTRFYKFAQKHQLFVGTETFEGAYYKPVINTMTLSRSQILEYHKQAVKRYYLRPRYILRAIGNIHSFTELKNYFKAGMKIALRK